MSRSKPNVSHDSKETQVLCAHLVDIEARHVRPARVVFSDVIHSIEDLDDASCDGYVIPGFVDAHVHIESSMLCPSQFARIAVCHGTVGTVSDPHEIANVLGLDGVRYMLDDAARVPLKFSFGAPSCVPATTFETSGAQINVQQTETLLDDPRIGYLAEMMNFPAVIANEPEVIAKIEAARRRGKPADGHAPGLRGEAMRTYFAAGISTDHECTTEEEAVEKLEAGVLIQIREGSAARNFDALCGLIDRFPGRVMFCCDDLHPDLLLNGHIDRICRRALDRGCDLFNVLLAACVTPVRHYGLPIGQLRVGDAADLVVLNSLKDFRVRRTFIDGVCLAEDGQSEINVARTSAINRFHPRLLESNEFKVVAPDDDVRIRVIRAHDELLTTTCEIEVAKTKGTEVVADPSRDVLKLTVVNRYESAPPAVAFVRGFGFSGGALASSVAHDSHNVIAVGDSDSSLSRAVNLVMESGGGLAAVSSAREECLDLPIAGLMSPNDCEAVAAKYLELNAIARQLGCHQLQAPLMTLSFLALLVIPSLKLSDLGLFDGDRFSFTDLVV